MKPLDRTVTSTLILTGDTITEHVGGYSDWERYRLGQVLSSKTTDIGRPKAGRTKRKRNASDNPAKLSQKQKRELDALPDLIDSLEKRLTKLQTRTTEPNFYQQPQEKITSAMKELGEVENRLKQSYERWEELEG